MVYAISLLSASLEAQSPEVRHYWALHIDLYFLSFYSAA
jgi:hypothetical protein